MPREYRNEVLRIPNFKPDMEQKNKVKLFPKSIMYVGTISKCPKCGKRGYLSINFKYDSCGDRWKKSTRIKCYRNLRTWAFHLVHKTSRGKYAGCCTFNRTYWDELDALLLYDKRIPETFKRSLHMDKYGRGFTRKGLKLWSATEKLDGWKDIVTGGSGKL